MNLRAYHERLGARFGEVNGGAVVTDYGDVAAEYRALNSAAALLDLSCRSRLCLLGADRQKFLHGQVTNDVNRLGVGEGCYALLVSAKGKIQSDLNIYRLENELLLDFEPGMSAVVKERLERYVIADDVEVVDAAPHYGLLSVQGPAAAEALRSAGWGGALPARPLGVGVEVDPALGELYVVHHARLGTAGFDLFVPVAGMEGAAERLRAAVTAAGGRPAGWESLEAARVEAGIPRYGADMDETNLAPEVGLGARAISYAKGCYIGQEVIARIRTYGQVTKRLCRLEFPAGVAGLPGRGAKLLREGREVGYVTGAVRLPVGGVGTGLGYVRREVEAEETVLTVLTVAMEEAEIPVRVTGLGRMDA